MVKIESIRKDKSFIKVGGAWKPLSKDVQAFIRDKDIYLAEADITFEGDVVTKITNIKKNNAGFKPGNKESAEDSPQKLRSMSVSYVKDLIVAGKVKIDNLIPTADIIAKFIQNGELDGITKEEVSEEDVK